MSRVDDKKAQNAQKQLQRFFLINSMQFLWFLQFFPSLERGNNMLIVIWSPNVTPKMRPNMRWKSVEMQADCSSDRKCDNSEGSCNLYITTKPLPKQGSHSTVTINKCQSTLSVANQPKSGALQFGRKDWNFQLTAKQIQRTREGYFSKCYQQ